ncbi:MAG: cell division protein FtsA [Alphaproteobacteria bacterium]|nr:cell division protein FtsA [Alphaproteobacteria bacterium]
MSTAISRNGIIAALDIGTTKISCFIARQLSDGSMRVIGIGHVKARGMKNSIITDMEKAETSIRSAVEAAEQMADERIGAVIVNISNGQILSTKLFAEMSISNRAINNTDVYKVIDRGLSQFNSEGREIFHCIPTNYILDGEDVYDPRGMYGNTLGVGIHLISVNISPVRNINTVIERCHLDIASKIVSPYASGISCLINDEKKLGTTIIEMGGGTTGIAIFLGGHIVYTASVPVGGIHVTNDIARGLTTTVANAERIKTLYGCTFTSPKDNSEYIKVPLLGDEDEANICNIPRSTLVKIIQPRIEETFELVYNRIKESGFNDISSRNVVITGGASQLQGVVETASKILGKHVRIGKPQETKGLPRSMSGPAFATCSGLLQYGMQTHTAPVKTASSEQKSGGYIGRIGQWLLQNF